MKSLTLQKSKYYSHKTWYRNVIFNAIFTHTFPEEAMKLPLDQIPATAAIFLCGP